ncbi:MAG: 30S ribosomal protein S15 [Methanosarcinaceae archaeon]|nr:30S ribosomal protein S15 [Methanosarcinaceae archaeon]
MAKMHTRRKGKSGSKRPLRTEIPEWNQLSADETKEIVVDLWGQGVSMSVIGMVLRDQYGVGDIRLLTGLTVSEILKEAEVAPKVPEDLANLILKAINLRKHLSANKNDFHNKRSLQLTESKIRRLIKYYHKTGVLSESIVYDPATAEVMLTA